MRWCGDHQVGVPADLAIVGYDDIEASAYIDVPLTTVHYAADIVSDLAVERLLALITAPDRLPAPEVTLIEPQLVIRASCGAEQRGLATTHRRRSGTGKGGLTRGLSFSGGRRDIPGEFPKRDSL